MVCEIARRGAICSEARAFVAIVCLCGREREEQEPRQDGGWQSHYRCCAHGRLNGVDCQQDVKINGEKKQKERVNQMVFRCSKGLMADKFTSHCALAAALALKLLVAACLGGTLGQNQALER
jgi:hypothetical protein